MPNSIPAVDGTHDFLLVFGVAAVVLGVLLVSQGVLPSQSAAHRVPRAHAALLPAERAGPAPDERLVAETSPATSVPLTPALWSVSSGVTRLVAACAPGLDLDHDLRLMLAALALQERRHARGYPAGLFRPPSKGDVPASVLILAETSVAHAEASPPSPQHPMDPNC
jgi:hypothetical protein